MVLVIGFLSHEVQGAMINKHGCWWHGNVRGQGINSNDETEYDDTTQRSLIAAKFTWQTLMMWHQTPHWVSNKMAHCCLGCRTSLIETRFWVVVICPIIKCLTVLEFSFILFDLCLFITIFNFILNYVPIVTFWIFTYHKIWILLIIFCFIWNYWIIYFLTCLEVF